MKMIIDKILKNNIKNHSPTINQNKFETSENLYQKYRR
jgi:hypothetical protein